MNPLNPITAILLGDLRSLLHAGGSVSIQLVRVSAGIVPLVVDKRPGDSYGAMLGAIIDADGDLIRGQDATALLARLDGLLNGESGVEYEPAEDPRLLH